MIIPKLLKWIYNTGQPIDYTIKELERIAIKDTVMNVLKTEIPINTNPIFTEMVKQEIREGIFGDIIGHSNIKTILQNMLDSVLQNNIPVSILLDGSAGCGKSLFLKSIEKAYPTITKYLDGSKSTKAGIFDTLIQDETNSIKFLVIDEIDKLDLDDQESLLTLIEDGRIIQTQKNGKIDKKYDNLSVIAASNDKDRMLYPLLTRFYKIKVKDYTNEEFKEIATQVLQQMGISDGVIYYIILKVLESKNPNIRTIKQIAKLCNNNVKMVDLLIENSG